MTKISTLKVGNIYGRLTLLEINGGSGAHRRCICMCECGNLTDVRSDHLLSGKTQSCRCLMRESAGDRARTHGLRRSVEYRVWSGMIDRCYNARSTFFADYGGRGIRVCERWKESFERFFSDMGVRPSRDHSIDRIDNNGNYEPGNCRWATKIQQSRNTRSNKMIIVDGETRTLAEWAECSGVNYAALYQRINRLGMSPKDAMSRPYKYQSRR